MSPKYHYSVYGLIIRSQIPLPEFLEVNASAPDITIRQGVLQGPPLELEIEGNGCWRVDESTVDYYWPEVGSLQVRDGREILFASSDAADPDAIRLSLIGPGMATILHQRGCLVLHASAVRDEDGVVAFVGPSGRGKSTTASLMLSRGYRPFTDDILAIDVTRDVPMVLPGPPILKLWPSSLDVIGVDAEQLPRIGVPYTKRFFRTDPTGLCEPLPLRAVYILHPDEPPEVCPMPRPTAILEIMTNSYLSEVLRFSGAEKNFQQCVQLAKSIPIKVLKRGASIGTAHEMATLLEGDIQSLTLSH